MTRAEPTSHRQRFRHLAPVLTLFLLSPMLGEVVGAALRLSYMTQPLRVAAILCFYGAGVVLIREITHRLDLNLAGTALLGLAFAVIEEGLCLQTIFNPTGPDGETLYGRAFEVNWFWAVVVCGYHVVWSVLIPIAVVKLVFPERHRSAWLPRPALAMFGVLFACGAGLFTLISFLRSDFRLSAIQVVAAVVIVALLVSTASRCTTRERPHTAGRTPEPFTAGLVGLGTGLVWFFFHLIAFIGEVGSFVWWTLGAALFAAATAAVLAGWARRGWSDQQTLALCFGAAIAAALFGLLLVWQSDRTIDQVFQALVVCGLVAGCLGIRRRLKA